MIRVLSELDVAEFWELRLRALLEEPESFASAHEESINTPPPDVAKRLQSSDDAFVLGAFTPKLIGTLGLFRQHGIKKRHKGAIWGMYVAPEVRGQGFGRALMLAAISRASTVPDLEQLVLTVATTNEAACRLYSSVGFTPYGVEPKALKVRGRYLDENLMALELGSLYCQPPPSAR